MVVRFDGYWMKSEPENVMVFPLTGRSLETSHIKTLSDVVTARELGVTEALEVIASAKKIPSEQRHQ